MTTRHQFYHHFGPKELEAIVKVLFSEINILRVRGGLAERTTQQALDALYNEYQSIPDYDWMEE
jgi:hypothetical protein